MLVPRQKVPGLAVDTLDGTRFDLSVAAPGRLTLVSFYRGLHCPVCALSLKELALQVPALRERGVEAIAISSDTQDRARRMADKVGAPQLRIGYGLPVDVARAWGLFISASRGKTSLGIEEPALFSEPGVFLVRPDQTLYWLSVQSMPFVRPSFVEMVQALDFIIRNDYPARGEHTGTL